FHVNDVISAIITSIKFNDPGFIVFNLGSGHSVSVAEIVDVIKSCSSNKFDVEYTHQYRKGEVLDSVADVGFIKTKLNWECKLNLNKGIQTIVC
ncbi:MAG: hypothetical protein MH472_01035, partial [Bacteroidia bacterium]|nr:hypothetical protein [Bacteroidia bacterium]